MLFRSQLFGQSTEAVALGGDRLRQTLELRLDLTERVVERHLGAVLDSQEAERSHRVVDDVRGVDQGGESVAQSGQRVGDLGRREFGDFVEHLGRPVGGTREPVGHSAQGPEGSPCFTQRGVDRLQQIAGRLRRLFELRSGGEDRLDHVERDPTGYGRSQGDDGHQGGADLHEVGSREPLHPSPGQADVEANATQRRRFENGGGFGPTDGGEGWGRQRKGRGGLEHTIEASAVTKIYESSGVGVHDIDLRVPTGSIVGLIGPSGSGKTTTVRLLTGLLSPDDGTVEVLGMDPAAFDAATRSRIGYLPQQAAIYPALTVNENLDFFAAMHGLRGRRRRQRRELVLDFVELTEAASRRAHALSGGMQRRLGLAAALIHRPELLFLDEPTAGIDPILRASVWETLSELRDDGRTIVLTTQYVSEAAYCDLVAVISEGRLVEWGTPEELRRRAFGGEMVDVVFADRVPWAVVDRLAEAVGAEHVESIGNRSVRITVEDAGSAIPILANAAAEAGAEVTETDQVVPEYDEVFVRIVDQNRVMEPTE